MVYVVRESATGKLYLLNVRSKAPDAVYHQFAKDILGEDQVDTGNVDIDVWRCPVPSVLKRTEEIKLP